MKMYIQKGKCDGVCSEIRRVVKSDREYEVTIKETKTSRNRRKKSNIKNPIK
jgi:hypothetical protein